MNNSFAILKKIILTSIHENKKRKMTMTAREMDLLTRAIGSRKRKVLKYIGSRKLAKVDSILQLGEMIIRDRVGHLCCKALFIFLFFESFMMV